ncbi:hypothetical protein [Actinoplanes italicus]|uniref:Uncharacterized protein n=1 Tax=Actinoplanes italicus TaxID=113567 RepID=A0A2T0K6Z6_9ACTN|nr:hypothetical protein [Actinoplanes italicus]PRX18765.1 hypothetical protein CLV67_112240 [Actinoplanes italicus]
MPALLLAGCATGPAESGAAPMDETARMVAQAEAALERYDRAVAAAGGTPRFVPVGDVTGVTGDFEGALADTAKAALGNGHLLITGAMPDAPAGDGEVVWQNGEREKVGLLSAEDALGRITGNRTECPECVDLEVTGARLATMRVETTRGPATAPAWEFTIKGSAVRVTRLAADGSGTVRVTPPSWDPDNSVAGLAISSAAGSPDSRQLTVGFTGSPQPASEPCGIDYTAEAVESASAVVVYLIETRHAENEACTAIGFNRTAVAELAAPLGERAVLDVTQGLPVPVTLTS